MVDRSDPAILDYYARRAREYERIYDKPERQAELRDLERLIVGLLAGRDLLEIACGTGYWTERIAPAAASIVATDASDEVLEVARSKEYPPGRVGFANADAYDPAAVPGRFTALFAGFFWSHVPRRRLAGFLAGAARRLEPGGRLVFIDNRFVPGSSTPIAETDDHGDSYQIRRLDDGSNHRVLKNFPDEAELQAAAATIGRDVTITLLTFFWCLSCTVDGHNPRQA